MQSGWKSWLAPLAIAAAAVFAVAALGGALTDIGAWYKALQKPSWQPPDWLFGPVWTTIFTLIAISAASAWRDAPDAGTRGQIVGLFMLNGILNVLWSLLFFYLRRPDWALIEVVALWLSIVALILMLWRFSMRASLLLLPYLAWVSLAAYLNLTIVRLN